MAGRIWSWLWAGVSLAGVLYSDPARACDPIGGGPPHVVDSAAQGADSQPPILPPIGDVSVYRASEGESAGCLEAQPKCGGQGWISFGARATDDTTQPDRIGYRVSIVGGQPPLGFVVPAAQRAAGDHVMLVWGDGATDDQEPFDVTLQVLAIDAAGNESAPQTVRVADPGSGGGCRVAATHMSGDGVISRALLIFLVLGVAVRRRRRRLGA